MVNGINNNILPQTPQQQSQAQVVRQDVTEKGALEVENARQAEGVQAVTRIGFKGYIDFSTAFQQSPLQENNTNRGSLLDVST